MCLFINVSRHPDNKPIILDEALKVFKYLVRNKKIFKPKYKTPYWDKCVPFLFGKCTLTSNMDGPEPGGKIRKGIHACVDSDYYMSQSYREFDAIIPKGTKVYFGDNNDIVAEKLIIYKNKLK